MSDSDSEKNDCSSIHNKPTKSPSIKGPHTMTAPLLPVITSSESTASILEKAPSTASLSQSNYTPSQSDESVNAEEKKWYQHLNPLRWGSKPPVPKERIVSREYEAGLWSLLTFQWMSPLMAVGFWRLVPWW
jgi:hypothetical protein